MNSVVRFMAPLLLPLRHIFAKLKYHLFRGNCLVRLIQSFKSTWVKKSVLNSNVRLILHTVQIWCLVNKIDGNVHRMFTFDGKRSKFWKLAGVHDMNVFRIDHLIEKLGWFFRCKSCDCLQFWFRINKEV